MRLRFYSTISIGTVSELLFLSADVDFNMFSTEPQFQIFAEFDFKVLLIH